MKKKEMTAREMAAHRWQQMSAQEREENIRKATDAARAKRMAMPKAKRSELAKKAAAARWKDNASADARKAGGKGRKKL